MLRLLFLLSAASAAQITARSPVLYLSNGRLWKNQTLQVRCDATDGTVPFLLNGQTLEITCTPPQYVYELQYLGTVPHRGQYNVVRTCKTRTDPTNATAQLQRQLVTANSALAGRRLLQIFEGDQMLLPEDIPTSLNQIMGRTLQPSTRIGNRSFTLHEALAACYGSDAAARTCLSRIRNQGATQEYIPAKCRLYQSGSDDDPCSSVDTAGYVATCGPGTPECTAARAWRTASQQEQAAYRLRLSFKDYMAATSRWARTVQGSTDQLTEIDRTLLDFLNATERERAQLADGVAIQLKDMNAAMDADANMTGNKFTDLKTEIERKLNEQKDNGEADRDQLLASMNDPALTSNAQQAIIDAVSHAYQALDNVSAAVNLRMDDVSDVLTRRFRIQTNENRDMYRTLREVTRLIINEVQQRKFLRDLVAGVRRAIVREQSEGRHPFLPDTGVEPTIRWDENPLVMLESVRLQYKTQGSPGVFTGFNEDWNLVCDTVSLVSELTGGMDWFHLISKIGPPGCNPAVQHDCECFVRRRIKFCTLQSGHASLPAWSTDLALDATVCSTGVSQAPDERYTRPGDMLVAANVLCRTVAGGNITAGARLANKRADFSVVDETCAVTFDELDSVGVNTHPLVALLGFFEAGFDATMRDFDRLFDSLYGVLPNNLDLRWQALERENAQAARCVTAGFLSLEPRLLPVYRVVPVATEAAVDVRINGELVSRTTDVTLNTPMATLLPKSDYLVIGDPRNESEVFDVPQHDISLAGSEYARRGTPTYLFFPPHAEWSALAWARRNGAAARHEAAQNLAYLYESTLLNGRCTSSALAAGSWCDIRDKFIVVPVPTNSSRLSFTPRTGSVLTAQVVVPLGDITQEVFSVCPVMQAVAQGSGSLLTFLSPVANGPETQNFTLIVHYADECPTRFINFPLPPGASYGVFVPRCGDTAHASLFRGSEDEGDACPGVQNVDLVAALDDYRLRYGNYDLPRVNITQATAEDEILLRIQRLDATVNDRLLNLLTGYINGRTFQGLPIQLASFEPFLAAMRNASLGPAFPPFAARPAAQLAFSLDDYEALTADYARRVAQNRATLSNISSNADELLARAISQQNANVEALRRLRNDTDLLTVAAEAYSRDYFVSSRGLFEFSAGLASTDRSAPPPGWIEARANLTREIWKGLAKNDSTDIVDASTDDINAAMRDRLGVFAEPYSLWTGFFGIILINVLWSALLNYNLAKADTVFTTVLCRTHCKCCK